MIDFKKHLQGRSAVVNVSMLLTLLLILSSCQMPSRNEQVQAAAASDAPMSHMNASDDEDRDEHSDEHRPELAMESPIELDPRRGQEIGSAFEAFLSPHQEGGEEEDMPSFIPSEFKSTKPSVARNERPSRGHGVLSFTNDLSKAYVHVAVEGVNIEDIVMFHIHCGRPGQLGPIIVDFSLVGDLQEYMADNVLALEITNEDIVATASHGEGIVAALTAGCPIIAAVPMDKVKTIAGMESIAQKSELYFNLHTAGQVYFGDIRGKLKPVRK